MKIKTFYLNSTKEIIVKIVKEILVLFKVEINDADDTIFDYGACNWEIERCAILLKMVQYAH